MTTPHATCIFCSVPLSSTGQAVRVQDALCGVALDSVHRSRPAGAETLIAIRQGLVRFVDMHEAGVDVTDGLDLQIERALLVSN